MNYKNIKESLTSGLLTHIPTWFLTLPILLQLLLTSNQFISSDFDRWIKLKITILSLYLFWYVFLIGIINIFRINLKYLALPIFFSLVVSAYICVTGENIEYEVYASINNTSLSETLELIFSWMFLPPLFIVVIISLYVYKSFLKKNSTNDNYISKPKSLIYLLIAVTGLSWAYVYERNSLYKTYPLNIPFYQKMYLTELYFFKKNYKKINYDLPTNLNIKNDKSIYILVIGESARKASMAVYGYTKDTTPNFLNKIKLNNSIAFNATASGISTRLSVPMLLSSANTVKYDSLSSTPTLIHAFNAMNYTTTLISNQESSGRNNDVISLMLSGMKNRIYINDQKSANEAKGWKYDAAVIPHVKTVLNNDNKNDFIVVHLMGSHWDYSRRYPENYSKYENNRIGNYDDSIRYTDYVVGQLIDLIEASGRPSVLFYTSDHGENLNDNNDGNYLHAVKEITKYEIEVPFFISFNNAFKNQYAKKADNLLKNKKLNVSHDNISHSLFGLAGLYDDSMYKDSYDLFSEKGKESLRYTVNRRRETVTVKDYLRD